MGNEEERGILLDSSWEVCIFYGLRMRYSTYVLYMYRVLEAFYTTAMINEEILPKRSLLM